MKRHLFRRMGRFLRPQALPLAGAAALAALSGLLALLVLAGCAAAQCHLSRKSGPP